MLRSPQSTRSYTILAMDAKQMPACPLDMIEDLIHLLEEEENEIITTPPTWALTQQPASPQQTLTSQRHVTPLENVTLLKLMFYDGESPMV